MKAILLDIEGTTTPIDFVHNTLFPYAKARMGGFILDNLGDLKFEIEQLTEEHNTDDGYKSSLQADSANSVSDYLKYLIDQDRKSTPLKTIQGMIWKQGYESGELVSPVYADVPAALKRWKDDGKTIAIYSSGSALAQRLLFRHTDHGDLTQFISDHFDTTVGGKRETKSYVDIAQQLNFEPGDVLFVSDVSEELAAASAAEMQVRLVVRDRKEPVNGGNSWKVISSFDDLLAGTAAS